MMCCCLCSPRATGACIVKFPGTQSTSQHTSTEGLLAACCQHTTTQWLWQSTPHPPLPTPTHTHTLLTHTSRPWRLDSYTCHLHNQWLDLSPPAHAPHAVRLPGLLRKGLPVGGPLSQRCARQGGRKTEKLLSHPAATKAANIHGTVCWVGQVVQTWHWHGGGAKLKTPESPCSITDNRRTRHSL